MEWADGPNLRAPESAIYVFGLALLLFFSCIRRWDGTHLLKYCNEGLSPVFINIISIFAVKKREPKKKKKNNNKITCKRAVGSSKVVSALIHLSKDMVDLETMKLP